MTQPSTSQGAPARNRGISIKWRRRLLLTLMLISFGFGFSEVLPCPKIAAAQGTSTTLPPSAELAREEKIRIFRQWMGQTQIPETATDAQKAEARRMQRVLTRSSRKALPTLSRQLITKAGLAGAAAGIWIHNGLILYNVSQCGQTDCPEPLVVDAEFRQAQDIAASESGITNGGPVFNSYDRYGTKIGSGMVLDATFTPASITSTRCKLEMTVAVKSTSSDILAYSGTKVVDPATNGGNPSACGGLPPVYGSSTQLVNEASERTSIGNQRKRFYIAQNEFRNGSYCGPCTLQVFGPTFSDTESARYQNPVYDMGNVVEAPPEYQPSSGDYLASPEESDAFYDAVRTDPEYQPATDNPPAPEPEEGQQEQHERRVGELVPEHGPEEFTHTNPDGSITTRLADGTQVTTWPDGTELIQRPDGTEDWKYPDGTEFQKQPDGTTVTKKPDGTTTTRAPDGTTSTRYPDGTTVRQTPNGDPEWTSPTGSPISAPPVANYPPAEPADPPYEPPPPADGSTNQGDEGCARPKTGGIIIPPINFEEKFPFSLIIMAKDGLGDMVGPAVAPEFDLPMVGVISLAPYADAVGYMRNLLWFLIGVILMPIFFYTLIKGPE